MSGPSMRAAAWAGLAAQVLFVLGWLVAAAWQGPDYSVLAHERLLAATGAAAIAAAAAHILIRPNSLG